MSKVFRIIVLLSLLISVLNTSYGQDNKTTTIDIKTSAKCDMCKDKLEYEMSFTKGVKEAKLNTSNAILTVQYNARKTDVSKLRQAINKVGYDADDLPAEPKARSMLPNCCK